MSFRNQYIALGYGIVKQVFTIDEVEQLRSACDELCEMAKDFHTDQFIDQSFFNLHRNCDPFAKDLEAHPQITGELRRVSYPYRVSKIFNFMRQNPKLLEHVQILLGPDLNQIVNQVNFNPPKQGTGWGWHQDYRFRKAGIEDMRNNFVQTITAIDPCSPINGGLRLIPESDQLGHLQLDKEHDQIKKYVDESKAIAPELQPGDVVFFNPFIVHGSLPNLSNQLRRVYINGYANAHTSTIGKPVLRDGSVVFDDQSPMEYEFAPQILEKSSKY